MTYSVLTEAIESPPIDSGGAQQYTQTISVSNSQSVTVTENVNQEVTISVSNSQSVSTSKSIIHSEVIDVVMSRTNYITNSTWDGAVPGNPGSPGTGWTFTQGSSGLTVSVADVGTVNTLQYIDFLISGTVTDHFDDVLITSSQTNAAVGQIWSLSTWVQIVQGDFSQGEAEQDLFGYNGDSPTEEVFGQDFNGLDESFVRFSKSGQTTNDLTTSIGMRYVIGVLLSGTYNFTIRLTGPQLELYPYSTQYIPTSDGSVTVSALTLLGPVIDGQGNTLNGIVKQY